MSLVPRHLEHKKVQVKVLNFATAASGAVAAAGTGLALIPVWYHISASGVGSAAVYAGTSGSELIRLKFGGGLAPVNGPWWDGGVSANKTLLLEVEGAVGVGQFVVWYIVHRSNAGDGALTL